MMTFTAMRRVSMRRSEISTGVSSAFLQPTLLENSVPEDGGIAGAIDLLWTKLLGGWGM